MRDIFFSFLLKWLSACVLKSDPVAELLQEIISLELVTSPRKKSSSGGAILGSQAMRTALFYLSSRQVGLYRVSGHERLVKELKEKLLRGKTLPQLSKVDDINVIAGVLKDFFRNLPEPLLTFHLNKTFMEAAGESLYSKGRMSWNLMLCLNLCIWLFVETPDEGNSVALLYQAISELPLPNRDTLACLMIHLQK